MVTELKTFIAVAQYGTFSSAAERIGLTQAAVSGHIKRLEEKIGFQLFDRTGHSAKLNNDGYRVLARAKTIVRLVETLGELDDERLSRDLRLGAIPSARSPLLDRALALFHERYADQRIQLIPDVSLHLLDQVDTGEIDLAIIVKPPFSLPPETRWSILTRDPYLLIVPSSCEESDWRRVLQSEPLLRYDRLSFGGRQVERFLRTLPFTIADAPEIPAKSMLSAVAEGQGVALVPLTGGGHDLPRGVRALPLHGKSLVKEVGVITSRQSLIEPTVNHLKDCLVEIFEIASLFNPATPLLAE
ncbi:LysR family transcriptional regulator [Novosphingobium flavum]|uniref:LysR family transcriptional regulator n=1 Tax=Novosphingobium flavum TaxID=1778672 RepID=A0A7X1FQV0_9SPHN|nr:LysR substrate-binding domain-containing protein [Novosphingobium flavum]MBC2665281.1 LysR family transcriptional regulator [Novosphingobium flavum]